MSKVRVRIAPSPTGTPHVGTAYIALFNYCFAKSQGGEFILRIEDTDQSRSRREHEDAILGALAWTGLTWDEGPDVGGPHGPYRQSERTELYLEHVEKLLQSGHAYKCFCPPERLELLRAEQQGTDRVGYDGHCMRLSAEEVAERESKETPYTVRMAVPEEGACTMHDVLRGEVTIDYSQVDHQVLLKSDGFPTYHLANVVDDHHMGITHVIRGEEWLPSLPKHLLLYQYFGWDAPQVIHLPLLRNEDSSKLSKRKNPTSIFYYRENGILPEALINFLGMMAYTQPGGEEIFSLEDMVRDFKIDRMHLGGPIFDQQKLKWVNQQHISRLDHDEICRRLIEWRFNETFLAKLVPFMRERMHKLGDFMQICDFMFYSDVTADADQLLPKKKEGEDTRDFLQKVTWELEPLLDFSAAALEEAVKKCAQIHGWSVREATHAMRVAVCGKTVAPPLYQVMEVLGSDVTRNRLTAAVNTLGPLGKKKLTKMQKDYQKASDTWTPAEPA